MTRRTLILLFGFVISLAAAPLPALAEDHLAEAIAHTKQAIDVGKLGQVEMLTKHAEEALKHARAAEMAKDNPHTKQGVTHLDAAIAESKKKNAQAATGHAEEALTHLQAAN